MMKTPIDPKFAFFSANVFQYLDTLPWSLHADYFKAYCDHHAPKPIPTQMKLNFSGNPFPKPGLLVAFHLGDHLTLPVGLSSCGVTFDVLIDRHTYSMHQLALQQASQYQARAVGHETEYLFSDDPRLAFRIRNSLGRNRHVLIFVDGNGGIDPSHHQHGSVSLLPVPFFSGTLWVKKGVAVLSYLLKVPIYVLFATGSEPHSSVQVLEPIVSYENTNRDIGIQRLMRTIYALLEQRIKHQPMQWECWMYLHQNGMLRIEKSNKYAPNPPEWNAEYMEHLVQDGKSYWLDKRAYTLYTYDIV